MIPRESGRLLIIGDSTISYPCDERNDYTFEELGEIVRKSPPLICVKFRAARTALRIYLPKVSIDAIICLGGNVKVLIRNVSGSGFHFGRGAACFKDQLGRGVSEFVGGAGCCSFSWWAGLAEGDLGVGYAVVRWRIIRSQ